MKRINLIIFSIFTLIISFTLLSLEKSNGQTNSSSSSSSGECIVCTQVVPNCSSNETLIPQTCNECTHCIPNASSSSGNLACSTDNDCPPGICSSGSTFKNYSCGDGLCNQIFYFADPCQFQSSSSGNSIVLNEDFNGLWKGKNLTCKKCKEAKKTTFNLCLINKTLEGTINIPDYIENGLITSYDAVSPNEVKVIINYQKNQEKEITFMLNDKRHLSVFLPDNGKPLEAQKTGKPKTDTGFQR